MAPFPLSPLRTGRDTFASSGSPVIPFQELLVILPLWIATWHSRHTTSVFLFLADIICTHLGTSACPFFFKSASFLIWCTSIFSVFPHNSHFSANSLLTNSVRPPYTLYGISSITAFRLCTREIPPHVATNGFLLGRSTTTCRHGTVFPLVLVMVVLYLAFCLLIDDLCLHARVFNNEVSIYQYNFENQDKFCARI